MRQRTIREYDDTNLTAKLTETIHGQRHRGSQIALRIRGLKHFDGSLQTTSIAVHGGGYARIVSCLQHHGVTART
ncbi:MAG: hypothetical protein BWY17_05057 [Deltaproteobacteria bacterium ADurb.Bin207]|nr:MAG: hypothetical protein BWY17_05057 [Deltaproteobacteria bacterium ADurb.Bin207]